MPECYGLSGLAKELDCSLKDSEGDGGSVNDFLRLQSSADRQRLGNAYARAQSNALSPLMDALLRDIGRTADAKFGAQYQQALGGMLSFPGSAAQYQRLTRFVPESKEERRARRIKIVKEGRIKQCRTRAEAELREYLGETLWNFPERVKKIVAMMDEVFSA